MPTIPIHEEISYYLIKDYNEKEKQNFLLGALTPDAINVNGFASKEKRFIAHVRDKDLNKWRENIEKFYYEEKNKYPKSFLLGYISHLLTDIIFDEKFYWNIRKKMQQDKIEENLQHRKMREDMNAYSRESKIWTEVKKELMKIKKVYPIKNITEEMIKEWLYKQIEEPLPQQKSTYITESLIKNLKNQVEEELQVYKVL